MKRLIKIQKCTCTISCNTHMGDTIPKLKQQQATAINVN